MEVLIMRKYKHSAQNGLSDSIELKNSWHIIVPVDTIGMFSETYITKTEKHFIYCECGHTHQYESKKNDHSEHEFSKTLCDVCGNCYFIECYAVEQTDIENYVSFEPFKYDNLSWDVRNKIDSYGWSSEATIHMPHIDFQRNRVVFEEIVIYTMEVNFDGNIEMYSYQDYGYANSLTMPYLWLRKMDMISVNGENSNINIIYDELEKSLVINLLNQPSEKIKWIQEEWHNVDNKLQNPNAIRFFIQYPKVHNIEILNWELFDVIEDKLTHYKSLDALLHFIANHRKEKSVLRAVYMKYMYSLKYEYIYDPKPTYLFTRVFDDPNLVCRALIEIQEVWWYFENTFLEDIFEFMEFLKKHYSEKSILKMFVKVEIGPFNRDWHDAISMLIQNPDVIKKNFKKVGASFKNIHDEFIRCVEIEKIQNDNIDFEYEAHYLGMEDCIKEFSFKLVPTSTHLYVWAKQLHNCMFSYANKIERGHTAIFGIFYQNTLFYAAEIKSSTLVQISGIRNSIVLPEHYQTIQKWLKGNLISGDIGSKNMDINLMPEI